MAGKKRRASSSLETSTVDKSGVATNTDKDVMAIRPEDTAAGKGVKRKKKRKKSAAVTGLDSVPDKLADTSINESYRKHTTAESEVARLSTEDRTQSYSENTNRLPSKTDGLGSSDSSSFSLAKLPTHLEYLHEKYTFSLIEIGSNSRYDKLVKSVIKLLSPSERNPNVPTKPSIVLLESKAECAPRLIAIVEAIKVHIAAAGEKWFQYNGLRGEILPFKPKSKRRKGGEKTRGVEDEERRATAAAKVVEAVQNEAAEDDLDLDEEEAFQPMVREPAEDLSLTPTRIEKDKVRSVPIITILIARLLVPELAGSYW